MSKNKESLYVGARPITGDVSGLACPFCGTVWPIRIENTPSRPLTTDGLLRLEKGLEYAHGCVYAIDALLDRRGQRIADIAASLEGDDDESTAYKAATRLYDLEARIEFLEKSAKSGGVNG